MDSPSTSTVPPVPVPPLPLVPVLPLPVLVPAVGAGDSELIEVLSGRGTDVVGSVDPDKVAVGSTDKAEFEA